MKKLKKTAFVSLNREEQKTILGGRGQVAFIADADFASCSATCLDGEGNSYIVTCNGENCSSSDFNGCSSDSQTVKCSS